MKQNSRLNRITLPVLIVMMISLTGFSTSRNLVDTRFSVTAVSTPTGPASISNGSSANYSFIVSINRDQQGLLDGTDNVPAIRPGLYAGNTRVAFREIDFPAGISSRTVTLNLNCTNNEVGGNDGSSGQGAMAGTGFLGWPWFGDDPAKITAKLNGTQSDGTVDILCSTG